MAVKSSGQLSLRYDIGREMGGVSSNISLGELSSFAGFSRPDAMSEFYGYSRNEWYLRTHGPGTSGTRGSVTNNFALSQTRSTFHLVSGWYRNDITIKKTQHLWSMGAAQGSFRQMIRAFYSGPLNRIAIQVYDRNGIRRMRREYPLHDNPNRNITGVTSSSRGWCSAQRGNADSDGFNHLAFTIDLSDSSYTNLKCFWNGQELTFSVNNQSSAVILADEPRTSKVFIGDAINGPGGASAFFGGYDNFFLHRDTLDSGINGETLNEYVPQMYALGNSFISDIDGIYGTFANGFEDGTLNGSTAQIPGGSGEWIFNRNNLAFVNY